MKKVILSAVVLVLIALANPAAAEDCIDIDLYTEVAGGEALLIYYYAINCGTAGGTASFTVTVSRNSAIIGEGEFAHDMPVGIPFSEELTLPIPPDTEAGIYLLCLSAILGTARDDVCAVITLDELLNVISFEKVQPVGMDDSSWGCIKVIHR